MGRKSGDGKMKFPEIKVEFNKTNSTNYQGAFAIFNKFDSFKTDGKVNSFLIDFYKLPYTFDVVEHYLEIIKKWKNTKIIINSEISDARQLRKLYDIYQCSELHKDAVNRETYCFRDALMGIEGWGCKHLKGIKRHLPATYREMNYYNQNTHWFEYGEIINDKIWQVHKDRILKKLIESANDLGVIHCPVFSMEKLEHFVKILPDTINPEKDEGWEYINKIADNGFSKEARIVGVRPKGLGGYGEEKTTIDITTGTEKETKAEKGRYVPDVKFEDVGGLGDSLQTIRDVIELPMKRMDLFRVYDVPPHKGILLTGPPGCGKTMIAKAIANEVNAHFIAVNGPEILSMWVGGSEANLRGIFSEAGKYAPSIILFDEIDSIAKKRTGSPMGVHDDKLVNQLLTLLDGFETNENVKVLATTNRPEMLDEAILRPGRFDYIITINKPDLQGCKEILGIYTKKKPLDKGFDLDLFAEKLVGLSGAEIFFIVREAALNSIRRNVDTKTAVTADIEIDYNNLFINEDDFNKAYLTAKNKKPDNEGMGKIGFGV
jgi:transitional endoplasmic reticulum ATPase